MVLITNIILFVLVIKVFPNIHILKLITGMTYFIQPIIYEKYVKKHFEIDKNAEADTELIKDRWDGFAISVAAFIHNNTDVIILSLFINLKVVSIYSVYSLVTSGLKQLAQSISVGIVPAIGNVYVENDSYKLNSIFNLYEYIMFLTTGFLFSVGGLLITPFVLLYTSNINDINYNEPVFGIILIIAEAIYCIREPYLNLAFSANRFKEIRRGAYLEAILNIIVSLILVFKIGIVGVGIGTLVAMIYRTMYQVIFLKYNILNRDFKIFAKRFAVFLICTILGIIICTFIKGFFDLTLLSWVIQAVLYSSIMIIVYIIMSIIFFRDEFFKLKNIIVKKSV